MRVVEAGKPNAEINVTPLVDVMLVLLIIFMVVTPMLQQGPAVKLPVTEAPPQKPEEKTQLLIAVTVNEMYFIGKDDKNALNEAALKARVSEEYQRNSNAPVVVKGDARLPYGAVKKAMQIVKDAGFEQVGLITEKRQGG